jgi:hypothetical protein
VFFTEKGMLRGLLAKRDVVKLLARDVPFVGALAEEAGRGAEGMLS